MLSDPAPLGDVNGDGLLDFFVFDRTSYELRVRYGDGASSGFLKEDFVAFDAESGFVTNFEFDAGIGFEIQFTVIPMGDLNEDGLDDFAITTFSNNVDEYGAPWLNSIQLNSYIFDSSQQVYDLDIFDGDSLEQILYLPNIDITRGYNTINRFRDQKVIALDEFWFDPGSPFGDGFSFIPISSNFFSGNERYTIFFPVVFYAEILAVEDKNGDDLDDIVFNVTPEGPPDIQFVLLGLDEPWRSQEILYWDVTNGYQISAAGAEAHSEVYQVSSDGEQSPAGVVDTIQGGADDDLEVGQGDRTGLLFENVSIPVGAVVTSATLRLTSQRDQGAASAIEIRLLDDADPDALTAIGGLSAPGFDSFGSVGWSVSNGWGAGQRVETPDLAALVQALIDADPQADGAYDLAFSLSASTGLRRFTPEEFGQGATLELTYEVVAGGMPPAARDDVAIAAEDGPPITVAVLDNDYDPDGLNGELTVVAVGAAANGAASLGADGAVAYRPDRDFFGTDSFTYTVRDGSGATAIGTVSITVSPTPDAPVAVDDLAGATRDAPVAIAVLANDFDPDDEPVLLASFDAVSAAGGVVVANSDGTLTYAPPADFTGVDDFSYVARDAAGNLSDPASVRVEILAPPSPFVTVTAQVAIDGEHPGVGAIDTRQGGVDDDLEVGGGDASGFLFKDIPIAAGATVTSATLEFSSQRDQSAFTPIQIKLLDDASHDAMWNIGGLSAPGFDGFGSTLWSVGDRWGAGERVRTPDLSGLVNALIADDPQGDATYDLIFALSAASGLRRFTPEEFGDAVAATLTLTYQFGAPNAPPLAVADSATVDEDSVNALIAVLGNDSDPDGADAALSVVSVSDPANGTAVVNPDGAVSYTPDPDFFGADGFSYVVVDEDGAQSTGAVAVTVENRNDAPTAVDDVVVLAPVSSVFIDVLANDFDVDGDGGLTIVDATQATYFDISIFQNEILFVDNGAPRPEPLPADSFTYTIEDPSGAQSTARVTILTEAAQPMTTLTVIAGAVAPAGQTASFNVLADGTNLGRQFVAAPAQTNGQWNPEEDYARFDFTLAAQDVDEQVVIDFDSNAPGVDLYVKGIELDGVFYSSFADAAFFPDSGGRQNRIWIPNNGDLVFDLA